MTRKCRVAVLAIALILASGGLMSGWLRGDSAVQATSGGTSLLQGGLGVEVENLALLAESDSLENEIFQTNQVPSGADGISDLWLNWAKQRITFNWKSGQGWKLRAAYFVHRNYEDGITETEADLAARTLGEGDFTSWATSVINDATDVEPGLFAQLNLNKGSILADNLTNQIYYAIKFVNPADASEYSWLRGKLDYRPCAHSPLYKQKTTKCTLDVVDGYYQPTLRKDDSMTVLELPEGYEIPDWDTEWQEILQGRWAKVQDTLSNTEKYLKNFVNNMNQVEQLLEGLAKTSGTDSDTEEIAQGIDGQKQRLKDLREYYSSLSGSDSGELDELQAKYQALLAENQELKAQLESQNCDDDSAELESLQFENARLKGEIENLTESNSKLSAENNGLRQKNAELGQLVIGSDCAMNSTEVVYVSSGEGQNGGAIQNDVTEARQDFEETLTNNVQDDVESETAREGFDVEVPKLGKSTSVNIWLGVALIAVAFGLVALWLKRLLER